jgi:hypothetical protein
MSRTRHPGGRVRPRRARGLLLGAGLLAGAGLAGLIAVAVLLEHYGAVPRLLGLYVEARASGHADWLEAAARRTSRLLQRLDRGDTLPYPDVPPRFGARVLPAAPLPGRAVDVATPERLRQAIDEAQPGDVITLMAGTYRFSGQPLEVRRGGRENAPITVRAAQLGTVRLEFDLLDGFHVSAPHWHFEHLTIRGACARHDDCEHAFHVVAGARQVVIRNNDVRDFNAHVKINGRDGRFPDQGRIAGNTFVNSAPRRTAAPVTPVDLVAADGWVIEDNLIADFVKAGGNQTSYGAFAKGGGSGNRFLRNVVICERRLRGSPGRRVGLSFGGGGSDAKACRDSRCVVEHDEGLMESNLIASCSDDGIYVNRSARSRLVHNTVLDTAGVSARFPEASVHASANLIDGVLRVRDGASIDAHENTTTAVAWLYLGQHPVRALFRDAGALDLRFVSPPPNVAAPSAEPDLCGVRRGAPAAAGAFEDFAACRGG